jgi:hypothetical protein
MQGGATRPFDSGERNVASLAAFPATTRMAGSEQLHSGIDALIEAFDFLEQEMLASLV